MTGSQQDALLQALRDQPISALPVREEDRALLGYADKLTMAPASVLAADVDQLRAAGFDDRAIHDACIIISYYAFVNRVADGLGVELEVER